MLPPFCKLLADGIEIRLHCTPAARNSRIGGIIESNDGAALKIAVTAPPEDGKANKAIVELLSGEWGLPKTSFSVARGAAGRRKKLIISGNPLLLQKSLKIWYQGRPEAAGNNKEMQEP